MKKVNSISKYSLAGGIHKSDISSVDEFEFIELAPEIFKNIRKMHNIDDSTIRHVFSVENIRMIDIRISDGK